jgi:hypothetical protein
MSRATVVDRFYQPFAQGDDAGMAACYHPDATFEDPAFGPIGLLLGWTPWFQGRMRTEALRALAAYRGKIPPR